MVDEINADDDMSLTDEIKMKKTKYYQARELSALNSDEVTNLQKSRDGDAVAFFESVKDVLGAFLSEEKINQLEEYFSDTMEKERLLFEAIISAFSTHHKLGFPENIYAIDLTTGAIEADRNGRRINYSTEVVAPCTSTLLHYINSDCNDVYVVLPPTKSPERTFEKLILECRREYPEKYGRILDRVNGLTQQDDSFEMPISLVELLKRGDKKIPSALDLPDISPLIQEKNDKIVRGVFSDLMDLDILPKDIYRLSVLSKYPGDLVDLMKQMEDKFPQYIRFERGERNSYKKKLSENDRSYFDIKRTARITIPDTNKKFFVEFQFKQTCMFFAHIRSHLAYENFRVIEAEYLALKDKIKKTEADKKREISLRKQCEAQRLLCVKIHRNAVHQSNMYVLHKVLWLEDNLHGLKREPELEDKKYKMAVQTILRDYIVESYEPFDGATAFVTSPDEYLNKSSYLKLIGILPESFDELGKGAKEQINKSWNSLTPTDIKDFNRITSMALKYQDVIRSIQKDREKSDTKANSVKPLDTNVLMEILKEQNGL